MKEKKKWYWLIDYEQFLNYGYVHISTPFFLLLALSSTLYHSFFFLFILSFPHLPSFFHPVAPSFLSARALPSSSFTPKIIRSSHAITHKRICRKITQDRVTNTQIIHQKKKKPGNPDNESRKDKLKKRKRQRGLGSEPGAASPERSRKPSFIATAPAHRDERAILS